MSEIIGIEAKFGYYTKANNGEMNDCVLIKEQVHMKDGTIKPNIRLWENYKKDFYITKPGFQNHLTKKEWEDINKLQKFSSTQCRLLNAINQALGTNYNTYKQACRNPYLYGSDLSTTTLIRDDYVKKFGELRSFETVLVSDIEATGLDANTSDLITTASIFKNKIYVVATKQFVSGYSNIEERIREVFKSNLKEHIENLDLTLEFEIADNPGHAVKLTIDWWHKESPDLVVFWNMNFDIPYMTKMLEKYGYDPADVFSDPKVPRKYRNYNYREGAEFRITASGKMNRFIPADRWHSVEIMAGFYIVDAMCIYRSIRSAGGNLPSYALNYVLNMEIQMGKMYFNEADHLEDGTFPWHQFMQEFFKPEYIVYNIFDCLGIILLNLKTMDLSNTFKFLCNKSDFNKFKSNPGILVDDLSFFVKENENKIAATCSDQMVEELDKYVVGSDGWIIALPAILRSKNGVCLFHDAPHIRSEIRTHTADLDIKSSYPEGGVCSNVSKETTVMELSAIKGFDSHAYKRLGLNLTGGKINSLEICQTYFNFPNPFDLLEEFEKEIGA